MASGRRRGASGSGGGDFGRQRAVFLENIAAGLGMRPGGRSPDAADQMRRIIASQDCDQHRTLEMFGPWLEGLDEDSSEESEHVGPLHDAARKGEMDTCKHLVENLGFDVDSVATDGSGLTPLACAVSHGIVIAARYFISKDADLNKQDHKGFAPLHYAAKQGNEGMARLLISRGACIDIPSSKGTPLHVAALYGEPGVLQILLDHHANPNVVSADLYTPIAALLCAVHEKVNEYVCLKCMKLLVKAGADLNSTNPDTPLVIATSKGLTECVTYLLEAGADANIPLKHDGSTPIEIAVKSGRRSLVEILFPFTSPIKSVPDWSVEGITVHVKSGPPKGKGNASVEDRKAWLKLLGGKAVAGKDYAGAAKFYTEAINLDPADATLYSNRSLCRLKIGENRDALRDADACIRLRPEWQKAYYRKGSALMSLKEYKEACHAFMDGLILDPSDVDMQNAYWEASEVMRKDHSAGSTSSQD